MKLERGDYVTLDESEMRDRNRQRFEVYHGEINAYIMKPLSERAGYPDGLWRVRLADSNKHITVVRRAIQQR